MRTTFVAPLTAETAREIQRKVNPLPASDLTVKAAKGDALLVGLDLGTNATCLKALSPGAAELLVDVIVPSVVGYAKEGIVENLLPGNAKVLYGQPAVKNRLYLRLVSPLANGVVDDMAAALDFVRHLRSLIPAPAGLELRVIAGVPASADRSAREHLAQALTGSFHKAMLIPEPFLAALGFRDEARLADPAYLDPVRNSLFVDIGAGTTDVCLVQGYFPTADDQISVAFAGDKVDTLLQEGIRRAHPEVNLSLARVRELKEQYSFVGKPELPIGVSVVIGGKARKLDLTEAMAAASHPLLLEVLECVKTAIGRTSNDTVAELMQNIILTGGGSRIRNLDTELQRLLTEEGYEKPRVLTVGENYKEHVAKGALVAGRQARESQWQTLGG
jgi:rod shape-determining protein MreB